MIVIVGDLSTAELATIVSRAQEAGIKDEIVHSNTTEGLGVGVLVVEDRDDYGDLRIAGRLSSIASPQALREICAKEHIPVIRDADEGPFWRKHDTRKWKR